MEKAHKAVDAVVDGVKKVAIGNEKKAKAKKEKGGDGGAEGPLGRSFRTQFYHHANKFGI
jgi:threonyl-tRNA synthetase